MFRSELWTREVNMFTGAWHHLSAANLELSRAATLQCLVWFFVLVCPVAVWCRTWKSWRQSRSLGHGDKVLIAALIPLLAHAILTSLSLINDNGELIKFTTTTPSLSRSLEFYFRAQTVYLITTTLLRIATFLTVYPYLQTSEFAVLRRIGTSVPGILLMALLFVSIEANTVFMTISHTQCTPVDWYWREVMGDDRVIETCLAASVVRWFEVIYTVTTSITVLLFAVASEWSAAESPLRNMSSFQLRCAVSGGVLASLVVLVRLATPLNSSITEEFYDNRMPIMASSIIDTGLSTLALACFSFRIGSSDASESNQPSPSNMEPQNNEKMRKDQIDCVV